MWVYRPELALHAAMSGIHDLTRGQKRVTVCSMITQGPLAYMFLGIITDGRMIQAGFTRVGFAEVDNPQSSVLQL